MIEVIKNFVKKHPSLISQIYYWFMNNRLHLRGRGNIFYHRNAFLRGSRIWVKGRDNSIKLGGNLPSAIRGLRVHIRGSYNKLIIEEGVGALNLCIYIEDDNNIVHIKKGTQISGKTELAAIEGTKIVLGEDSMLSANITLRTGDSHSVLNASNGNRINPSKDIVIGNHVWIGNTVIITKGTILGENSIVATGSVVAGKSFPRCSVVGGNPAKVIKEGVSWGHERI